MSIQAAPDVHCTFLKMLRTISLGVTVFSSSKATTLYPIAPERHTLSAIPFPTGVE